MISKEDTLSFKILMVIIFITLTMVAPVSSYFLHFYQYNWQPTNILVTHASLALAALTTVGLVWVILTNEKVQKTLGIRIQEKIIYQRIVPLVIFSTLIPTIITTITLFKIGLVGLLPGIHLSVQTILLSIVVGWFTTIYTRQTEAVSTTGIKNTVIVIIIATICALAGIFVINNIYSELEMAREIFKISYPTAWYIVSQTIPLVNFPSAANFTLTWILIIFYYILLVLILYILIIMRKGEEQPLITLKENLYKTLENITDEDERKFLEEAIGCAIHGFNKASIVLAWSAAVNRMHKVIEKLGFKRFNEKLFEKQPKDNRLEKIPKIDSLNDLKLHVKDHQLLLMLMYLDLIDLQQENKLYNFCLSLRNNCAHPGKEKVTDENLIAFYSNLKEIIFDNEKFKI